ncbi:MAG: helix-turn-helix domain-containing protein [Syntrophobacteraceae bacterium]
MLLSCSEVLELEDCLLTQKSDLFTECAAETGREGLQSLEEMEKEHIRRVLKYIGDNYGETCKILGITRPTLRKKMIDYGLRDSEK